MAGAVERVEGGQEEESRQAHHHQQHQQQREQQVEGQTSGESRDGNTLRRLHTSTAVKTRTTDGSVLITRIRRVEPASRSPSIALGSPCGLVRRILVSFPSPEWNEGDQGARDDGSKREGLGEEGVSEEKATSEGSNLSPLDDVEIAQWGPEDHKVYDGQIQYDRSPEKCSNPRLLSKAEKLQVEMMWQCFERVQAHHGLYTKEAFPWDTFPQQWIIRETSPGDPGSDLNKSLNRLLSLRPLASNVTSKVCYNLLISPDPPDLATYNILLLGFTRIRKSALSYATLQFMENIRVAPDPYTIAALLNMYVKSADYLSFRRLSENIRMKLATRSGSLWSYSDDLKWYVKDTWFWIFEAIVIGYLTFGKPKHASRMAQVLGKYCSWRPDLTVQTSFMRYYVEQRDSVRGKLVWEEIKKLEPDERAYHWILRLCRVCKLKQDLERATEEARALGFDPVVLQQKNGLAKEKGLGVSRKNKAPDLKSMPRKGWGLVKERIEEKALAGGRKGLMKFTKEYDERMSGVTRPLLEAERRSEEKRVELASNPDRTVKWEAGSLDSAT
ncbi:hypothetical protein BJ508DRAFT_335069 [Ascobolus immersus RN42]|uniref:Uncharacterized protein n=1 Tax=Ascobolus immersus RN42 TaxID=1160509 RepID=A0A3N4HDT7_ASCIM|nr:hypothetical protein BJ508DRAFT_335069 [Ascobolus immersus RN42]